MPDLSHRCESGCYMFPSDSKYRKKCEEDCRLLKGEPVVTRPGLVRAAAAAFKVGRRIAYDKKDD